MMGWGNTDQRADDHDLPDQNPVIMDRHHFHTALRWARVHPV
jgi:hypothetical protein